MSNNVRTHVVLSHSVQRQLLLNVHVFNLVLVPIDSLKSLTWIINDTDGFQFCLQNIVSKHLFRNTSAWRNYRYSYPLNMEVKLKVTEIKVTPQHADRHAQYFITISAKLGWHQTNGCFSVKAEIYDQTLRETWLYLTLQEANRSTEVVWHLCSDPCITVMYAPRDKVDTKQGGGLCDQGHTVRFHISTLSFVMSLRWSSKS